MSKPIIEVNRLSKAYRLGEIGMTIRFPSDGIGKPFFTIDIEDNQGSDICQALSKHEPFIEPDQTIWLKSYLC